jgi:hypothetical protein
MNAPVTDYIALPARPNPSECKAIRDGLTFPAGYGNYYSGNLPYSATLKDLMANRVDEQNHAIIRDLMNTAIPVDVIATAISSHWFRSGYNTILHNMLLIINQMHVDGHDLTLDIETVIIATASITYPDKSEHGLPILKQEKLHQAVAVIRFIAAVGRLDANVMSKKLKINGPICYSIAISNPHLDTLIRENRHRTDEIINLMKGRSILRTKKGLAPVLLALGNDRIKELTTGNAETMNKMFDYYRERNIGDTADITPFLEYLDTANAMKPGYL